MSQKRILITGASGLVGNALCLKLSKIFHVCASVRNKVAFGQFQNIDIVEASLHTDQNWLPALFDVSTVIHCGAKVHATEKFCVASIDEFRRVNVQGTLHLARQASEAGVQRFIFLSSIKVNGSNTQLGAPFTPDQIPSPGDPYGVSKHEAEIGLRALSEETGMEVVIIRPPLVYGPGVKANFLSMMCWLSRGIPLPLGCVTKNQRSFVFLENLVDLIQICIDHPLAANQTFLVSDDEDLSTVELLRRISSALRKPLKLIPVPIALINLGGRLIGRSDISERLCCSLHVDIRKTKNLLGWSPPVSLEMGLSLTVAAFLKM